MLEAAPVPESGAAAEELPIPRSPPPQWSSPAPSASISSTSISSPPASDSLACASGCAWRAGNGVSRAGQGTA